MSKNLLKIIAFIMIVGIVASTICADIGRDAQNGVSVPPQQTSGSGSGSGSSTSAWRYAFLPTVTIAKNSQDGTMIYNSIKTWCLYPETMTVSAHNEFQLYFDGLHLKIRNLQHDYIGSNQVTLTCNNEPKSFTLHIVNANPVITSTPVTSVTVDHLYIYDVEASDSDGDAVWFSLVQGPAGMSIETVSGIISWIPTEAQIGNNAIVVKAFDAFGGETTQTYTILVSDIVRNPPTFTSTPSLFGKVGNLYIYDANAEDADYDVLTYSLTSAPAGMTINTNTGVITWTPAASQAGPNDVAVSVTDSRFVTTQRFTISVDSGVAVSIVAEPVSGLAPLTVRFTPVITSGDGPFQLQWDFDGNGVTDLTTTQNNALIPHYYFNSYNEGTYNVKLTVIDAQGDSGIATVTIKANPKPEYLPKRIFRVDRITTINEYLSPGEDVELYINFKNEDNYDLKHVKVTSVISELGVRQTVGPFKLEKGDEVTKRLVLEIPQNVAPGEYNIRTTISNYNGIKRIKYRTVIIK